MPRNDWSPVILGAESFAKHSTELQEAVLFHQQDTKMHNRLQRFRHRSSAFEKQYFSAAMLYFCVLSAYSLM